MRANALMRVRGGGTLPSEFVCLRALRHISIRAAAILDRYAQDPATWVPATSFNHFLHTLCWGNFADLDLRLLEGFDPADRTALLEELRRYHEYLFRQRERVDRFHRAYRSWLDERWRAVPRDYAERLHQWRRRFGATAFVRVTGLAAESDFQRFMTDPAGHMAAFEQAFAELAQQQAAFWRSGAETRWFAGAHGAERAGLSAQIEQALSVLELPEHAPLAEIQRAYRRRAKMLHPDWQGEKHSAQMAALNGAYQLLCEFHRLAAAEREREWEGGSRSYRHEQ